MYTEFDAATGEMVLYDEAGNEVRRWPAYGSANAGMSSQATPGTLTIAPDGRAIAPSTPPIDPRTAQPQTAPADAVPIAETSYQGGSSRGSGNYSRSYGTRSYGGGVSSGGGYSGGGGTFDGGGGGTIPRYGDGTTHPFFGGAPRTPGGIFAQQDDGYDDRQQITNPDTGASAGPFGVTAPRSPDGGTYGSGGGSSGGGGGLAREMIGRIRGNVMGKVSGMGPGASPSEGAYLQDQRRYEQRGRRMERASDRYNEALGEPLNMPVVGWSKRQGYKPGTVSAALSSPGSILADVFPDIELNTATDPLTDLPMTDLAMLLAGTRGRGLMSKTPTVKVPGILKRQAGYEQPKPDFKRSLNPSKVVNRVAQSYKDLVGGSGDVLNTEELLGNLAQTKRKSAVGQGLRQQAEFDPGGALDQIGNYVHAAFAPMGNSGSAQAYKRQIDRELMALGPQFLRKKPKRMASVARHIGNAFLT